MPTAAVQVRKSERITLAVTLHEYEDVRFVAAAKNSDEGPLFRSMSLRDIRSEARRLRAVLRRRGG